jgi:hypothetical protein
MSCASSAAMSPQPAKASASCLARWEQKFVAGPDGELQPLTSGSTRPVAQTATHPGICKIKRYAFGIDLRG